MAARVEAGVRVVARVRVASGVVVTVPVRGALPVVVPTGVVPAGSSVLVEPMGAATVPGAVELAGTPLPVVFGSVLPTLVAPPPIVPGVTGVPGVAGAVWACAEKLRVSPSRAAPNKF